MEDREFDYINIIPLVDVMMVLLTIVLMTSTFIASGVIPVELPKVSQNVVDAPKNVIISIDKMGNVYLESSPVTLSSLRDKLLFTNKEAPVVVRADRELTIQRCVDVLGVIYGMGFRKVALQTEKGGS